MQEWPISRVRQMTLEEYTNDHREDAFVYWLELRSQELGSILGGSSFKFGIARRADGTGTKRGGQGRSYSRHYMWQSRLGQSPQEAWEATRQVLIDVIDAAQARRLEVIDGLPLGNTVRWKLAFLYQDRQDPLVFPIYKKECLFYHHQRSVDPDAKAQRTPWSAMYRSLSARLRGMDVFSRAEGLWDSWRRTQDPQPRDWIIPLAAFGLRQQVARQLCALEEVTSQHLPLTLEAQFEKSGIQPGDRLALLDEDTLRARGLVQSIQPGDLRWEQVPGPVALPLPQAPSQITEVTAWRHREAIWGEQAQAAPSPAPEEEASAPCPAPQNVIFYGPPGTGKTFRVAREALRLCGQDPAGLSPEQVTARLQEWQRMGRIELVTFHPSYSYEEFVEGIRPVLGQGEELGYRCTSGAFKRIALQAMAAGLPTQQEEHISFTTLWEALLEQVDNFDGDYLIEGLGEGIYALQRGGGGRLEARRVLSVETGDAWLSDAPLVLEREAAAALWSARQQLDPQRAPTAEEIKTLVRRVRGHTRRVHAAVLWPLLRELENLARRGPPSGAPGALARRRHASESLRQAPEHQPRFDARSPAYVLIIDEINRGNLSKVAGELITLLEPSRRMGQPDATVVRLPTSQELFAVPPNLHVLATMNTADRSIALLDVALRRRFTFVEVMPEGDTLEAELLRRGADPGLARLLAHSLAVINERISFLYDRDHQIGHAYLMDALDAPRARDALVQRILPLLQEYFYDAWDRICLVLGCPYDEQGRPLREAPHCYQGDRARYRAPLITATAQTERDILGIDRGDYEPRLRYRVSARLLEPAISQESLREHLQSLLHQPLPDCEDEEILI